MKSLKSIVRNIFPRTVSLWKEIKYKEIIKVYKKGLNEIKKKSITSEKPKVAFVINFPSAWNSLRTVYEAAEKMGLNPLIVCTPNAKLSKNKEVVNEAYNFFEHKNVNAINADLGNGAWFNLKEYNPDYVFYTRPYNDTYPEKYRSNEVCQYAKICYIPYGYIFEIDYGFFWVFNSNFILQAYKVFPTGKIALEELKKRFAWQIFRKRNEFKYLGFPRLDLLTDNIKQTKKDNLTIAWLPRWEFDSNIKGQKFSHFLEYYRNFMKFVNENKNMNFIVRPHPQMFETILREKVLTQTELDNIKNEMKNTDNLEIDTKGDYLETLFEADILIADFTSLLIEYFVTGKPIIYCDNAKNFTKETKIMDETLYHAQTWNDIESQVKKLMAGNDEKREERKEAIKKLEIDNSGNIGMRIMEYIIKDYEEKK